MTWFIFEMSHVTTWTFLDLRHKMMKITNATVVISVDTIMTEEATTAMAIQTTEMPCDGATTDGI
jgi:hypothetical protein